MSYLPPDGAFTTDITFCDNAACPFDDCKRHLVHLDALKDCPGVMVSVAGLCGVCRKYIGYLVEEEMNEKDT